MNEQTRSGDAGLAAGAEYAVADPPRRLFNIGIFQHDGRRFSAQLQRRRDQFFRRHVRQMPPGSGAAGKGNFAHLRMTSQRIANYRTFARQHAQQPGGQPGLLKYARQLQRHQRRRFRRLEDHRVPRGDGRRNFLHFAGDGRVPRRNRRHHAQRFIAAQGQQIRLTRRRQLALQQFAGGGKIARGARRAHHQPPRFRQRFTVVAALLAG